MEALQSHAHEAKKKGQNLRPTIISTSCFDFSYPFLANLLEMLNPHKT